MVRVCSLITASFMVVVLGNTAANSQTTITSLARSGKARTPSGGNLLASGLLSDPTILYENGKYRMWFAAVANPYTAGQVAGIAYAESLDGMVWTPKLAIDSQPALVVVPTPGGWDAGGIETPFVLKGVDGRYYMYYTGVLAPGAHRWAIGLATSNDGLVWSKVRSTAVLQGRGTWEGPASQGSVVVGGASEPSVVYDSTQRLFKMWYTGLGVRNGKMAFRTGYAISSNGVDWSALPDPVLEPPVGTWDDAVISHVNVVYDPVARSYHLFYFGTTAQRYQDAEKAGAVMIPGSLGHASSADGVHWVRDPSPVLAPLASTWEAWTVGGPAAIIQNRQLKLWYFASPAINSSTFSIGLATTTLP